MKEFWKKLSLCFMVIAMSITFFACGEKENVENKDLDGDGQIAVWETMFENASGSKREIVGEVVEIKKLSDLKAINNLPEEEWETTKIYKLMSNIDCKGEKLSINLRNSYFYGNNKTISNFKIDKISNADPSNEFYGVFYNGHAIYDLNIFAGMQSFTLGGNGGGAVGTFVNVPYIENVKVRGSYSARRKVGDGSKYLPVQLSLLVVDNDFSSNVTGSVLDREKITKCIFDSSIDGKLTLLEDVGASAVSSVGGIMATTNNQTAIKNCVANVNIETKHSQEMSIGGVAGINNGFITGCQTSGVVNAGSNDGKLLNIGGVVGVSNMASEVRNSKTTSQLKYTSASQEFSSNSILNIGGIVGQSIDANVNYSTSDANIEVKRATIIFAGGICGNNKNTVFDNILSRGNIDIVDSKITNVSNMIGCSERGYIQSAIISTKINVNNENESGVQVNIGTVTFFEPLSTDYSVDNTPEKLTSENSPSYNGIYVTGKNTVKLATTGVSYLETNLGIANNFSYEDRDIIVNNPEDGEDPEYKQVRVYPQVFKNIYIQENTDKHNKFEKYSIIDQTSEEPVEIKNNYIDGVTLFTMTSEPETFISYCVNNWGFKYGFSYNEIDLSSGKIDEINFTLNKNKSDESYYNQLVNNGNYSAFDKELNDVATLSTADELLGYYYYLIKTEKTKEYTPMLIGKDFLISLVEMQKLEDETIDIDSVTAS